MKRIKQGRWVGVALCMSLCAALAPPPAGAGTGGDAGVVVSCLNTVKQPRSATECQVPVTANRVTGNACQISVAERVRFNLPVQQLRWTLSAAAGSKLLYRFRPGDGVVIDGNTSATGGALYERDALGSTEVLDMHRVRDRNQRENTYTIHLQWRPNLQSRWSDCDALDPFLSNES